MRRPSRSIHLILLMGALTFASGCRANTVSPPSVCFDRHCVVVEIADTPYERQQGLKYRPQLEEDKGMLFIFPLEGRHDFWMKDTLIPLDMIWMDRHRRVIDIEHRVQPCRAEPCPVYGPVQASAYVLEVPGGYAAGHGIKPGDEAVFHLP